MPEAVCWGCKKPGHRRSECDKAKQQQVAAVNAHKLPHVALPLADGEILPVVIDTGTVACILPLSVAQSLERRKLTVIEALTPQEVDQSDSDPLRGVTGHDVEVV